MIWTLCLVDCFSTFCLIFFFWIFVLFFCLDMFLCVLILATSLFLFLCIMYICYISHAGKVALYSRCPVRPSSAASLIISAGISRGIPCIYCVCPSVVVGFWLLLAHQWAGFTFRMTSQEDWHWLQWMKFCLGLCHRDRFTLVGLWWLLNPLFACVICGANCFMLWYYLKLSIRYFVSGALWEGLQCMLWSATVLPILGQGRSYKVICGWVKAGLNKKTVVPARKKCIFFNQEMFSSLISLVTTFSLSFFF